MGRELVQGFSETFAVALPVGRTTEFLVPKEPKRADLFATIQTGQTELSKTESTAAVTQITS